MTNLIITIIGFWTTIGVGMYAIASVLWENSSEIIHDDDDDFNIEY